MENSTNKKIIFSVITKSSAFPSINKYRGSAGWLNSNQIFYIYPSQPENWPDASSPFSCQAHLYAQQQSLNGFGLLHYHGVFLFANNKQTVIAFLIHAVFLQQCKFPVDPKLFLNKILFIGI